VRLRPLDPAEVSAGRLAVEALAVALLCVLALWPFRLYGFDAVDEGTQLAQIERAAAGERPYLDFETGYTPGYFAFEGWLLRAGDGGIAVMRTFGVALQGVVVGTLFAVVRAWVGGRTAAAVALLYVAFFLPASLRTGAPFNVPYPGWLAALAALGTQVMVARQAARRIRRRRLLLLACGAMAGLAFSVKPNSGLLVLAGVALALAATWSPKRRSDLLVAAGLRGVAVLATVVLLAPGFSPGYAAALLVPVMLAAARSRPSFEDGDAAMGQLGAVAAGFATTVLPWLIPLWGELGGARVLREVLLLDGGVVDAYLLPLDWPAWPAVVLAAGAATAHVARGRPRLLPAIAGVTLLLMAVAAIPTGARPAAENVLLWLGPILVVVGLADRAALDRSPRERAALVFLAIYSLQLFPRPDFIHVAMGGPPLALAAALLWRRHERRWRCAAGVGERERRWLPRAALLLASVLALGRAAPASVPRALEPVVELDLGARAPVVALARHADGSAWMADILEAIDRYSDPGDAIFAFPDVAGLGFLAGRRQPFHHLYFVPGRPDRDGERRTVERLRAVAPRLVLVCPPHVDAFSEAPRYFARLGAELERAYAPATEAGGCVLRVRREADGPP